VTATFNKSATEYALTVTKAGTGTGTVECKVGAGALGACAAKYPEGTKVALTATAAAGSTLFAGWSEACTGTGSCEVTMTAAMKVTATFNKSATEYALTVTKAGSGTGTVECNTGLGAGLCASFYPAGTKVKLTETPAGGSTFAGWSEACSGTGSCEVTMTAAMKATATFNFAVVSKYPLTITKAGTGTGTVQCNTGSGAGACAAEYNEGTKVTLTATAAAGSTFAGWSVSGQPGACPGTGSCEVTISAATSVIAWFNTTPVKFPLTITKAGSGSGTVECNTGSGAGACASEYNAGTVVTLTATAAAGSTFAGWSGACTGTGSCEVTISAAKSVTATFTTKNPTTACKDESKIPVAGQHGGTPFSLCVSGGKALLKLNCSAARVCHGNLKLTIQIKQGHKTKTVVIGRASYRIAAGQSKTIKIKLSGVANQLLKQFKTLKATLTGPGRLHRTVKLKRH
jgi:Divergent InlB B-repeat domain